MTTSSRVLALLLDGPMTTAELVAVTGLPLDKVHNAVCTLGRNGHLASQPVRYEITTKGLYRLDPEADPECAARREAIRQRRLLAGKRYRDAKRLARGVVRRPKVVKEPKERRFRPAKPPVAQKPEDFPVEQRIVAAPLRDEGIVSQAIKSRRTLEQVWAWN